MPKTTLKSILLQDTDNDTQVRVEKSTDEDKIRFDTAGAERVIIDETGKVGVGTSAPIAKLDVAGKIAISLESSTPDQPLDGQGYVYSKPDGKLYWRSHDLSEVDLTAGDASSSVRGIQIDTDGNGSTDSTLESGETLVLKAGTNVSLAEDGGVVTINSSDANTTYSAGDGLDLTSTTFSLDLKASAGLKIDSTELAIEPTDFAGSGLEDDGSDNLRLNVHGLTEDSNAGDLGDSIAISDASDSNLTKKITLTQLKTLVNTGAALVVDSDADTKIQVEESADEDKIRFDTAGAERMIIDNSGKIGIGTSTPSESIHVKSTGKAAMFLEADTDNTTETDTAYIKLSQDNAAVTSHIGFTPDDGKNPENVNYSNSLSNALLVTNDWDDVRAAVQIGTKSAVVATFKNGRLGIGNNDPASLLDVNGDADVGGTLSFNESGFGAAFAFGGVAKYGIRELNDVLWRADLRAADNLAAVGDMGTKIYYPLNLHGETTSNVSSSTTIRSLTDSSASSAGIALGSAGASSDEFVATTDWMEMPNVISGGSLVAKPTRTDLPYQFFDGFWSNRIDLKHSRTHTFVINMRTFKDFPAGGLSYGQGSVYIGFFTSHVNFKNVKVETFHLQSTTHNTTGRWAQRDATITSVSDSRNVSRINGQAVFKVDLPVANYASRPVINQRTGAVLDASAARQLDYYVSALRITIEAGDLPLAEGQTEVEYYQANNNSVPAAQRCSISDIALFFDRRQSGIPTSFFNKFDEMTALPGGIFYGSGTASAPTISFSKKENSGLYFNEGSNSVNIVGGGNEAITVDGSGNVTKIGQDSPSSNQVLSWDGSKAVWANAGSLAVRTVGVDTDGNGSTDNTLESSETLVLKAGTNVTLAESGGVVTINSSAGGGGDITAVAAGTGLSGGGTTGDVTLNVDIDSLAEISSIAHGDMIAVADVDDSNAVKKMSISNLSAFQAGWSSSSGYGIASFNGRLYLKPNDLGTAAAVDPAADILIIEDADDSSTVAKKTGISDLIAAVGGTGLAAANGVLSVDINGLTADSNAGNLADSIAIADASDSDNPKKITLTQLKTLIDTNTVRNVGVDTDGNGSTDNTLESGETLVLKAGTNVTLAESGGVVTINSSGGGSVRTVSVDTNGDGSVNETLGSGETLTLKAGTNVTLAESGGVVTINSSGGGGGGISFDGSTADGILTYKDSDEATVEPNLTFDGSTLSVSGDIEVAQYIKHVGDDNTFIQFADDSIGITAGGEQLITVAEAGQDMVTIGDGGDVDFRVRTLNDDNTLYIEGSTDRIGVGTSSPSSILHVKEASPTLTLQRENNSNASTINFIGAEGNAANSIIHDSTTNDLVFKTFNGSAVEEILRLGDHYGQSLRQVVILSGSSMAPPAMQPRSTADISFFVSGSIGSRGTTVRGTSVFGGDLVVSGSIFDGSGNAFTSGGITSVIEDTSPQLGANLDTRGYNIVSSSGADIGILPDGSGKINLDGNGSTSGITVSDGVIEMRSSTGSPAKIDLYCEVNNAHKITLTVPAHSDFSGNVNFRLPNSNGTNGQALVTDGSGNTSWSTISGGSGISVSSQNTGDMIYYNGSAWTATAGPVLYYTVSANGSSAYRFSGPGISSTADNPTLYLYKGFTYVFKNNATSHPFAIRANANGSGFFEGISGSQTGTQTFIVPHSISDTSLVYQCTIHSGMVGNLTIV